METLIVHPETKAELKAIKSIMKVLKLGFKKALTMLSLLPILSKGKKI